MLLKHIAHVRRRHVAQNTTDVRKVSYVHFEYAYTGYDALFIDCFTNYLLSEAQELEATEDAINSMYRLGILDPDFEKEYVALYVALEDSKHSSPSQGLGWEERKRVFKEVASQW